jgi:hypothetical protein
LFDRELLSWLAKHSGHNAEERTVMLLIGYGNLIRSPSAGSGRTVPLSEPKPAMSIPVHIDLMKPAASESENRVISSHLQVILLLLAQCGSLGLKSWR